MSKSRIIITQTDNRIHFYLRCRKGTAFLFSQKYTDGVYRYFRDGRSDSELHKFHGWGQNPCLDHTIEKCVNPSYRRYAMNELSA
ncbi:MAG: hypothetical protein ACSW8J_00900 [bacterium]